MGAGAKHRLVFVDRLLATLVHLRHATTHGVLACWFGVDRSTITRAIGEVRPLLAERGCTVSPDVRLRTLAEVVDHLGSSGTTGIIDGTEIRVRRPAAGRKDQRQRKAHSSRRIRVEHGIAHLQNWRALARHLGRREHISDTVQAVASLLSHQQIADLHPTPQT
ncbi:helix-turn-helix domain-containing protein [Streptomyces sp. NRRL S-455]|uniref:helix-turn-helix domain-containing protein n=1 Tax=Streptomyces sp. NRRL S-455 TaxID=1463908 RepID=UPI000567A1A9